jgi:hypothetical protein
MFCASLSPDTLFQQQLESLPGEDASGVLSKSGAQKVADFGGGMQGHSQRLYNKPGVSLATKG